MNLEETIIEKYIKELREKYAEATKDMPKSKIIDSTEFVLMPTLTTEEDPNNGDLIVRVTPKYREVIDREED